MSVYYFPLWIISQWRFQHLVEQYSITFVQMRGRRDRDRVVVGFTTTICSQCLSPLMLCIRISIRARCTTLSEKVCQWLATDRLFSPSPPVSSTYKTDRHDITEIFLKVALNTINQSIVQITTDVIGSYILFRYHVLKWHFVLSIT